MRGLARSECIRATGIVSSRSGSGSSSSSSSSSSNSNSNNNATGPIPMGTNPATVAAAAAGNSSNNNSSNSSSSNNADRPISMPTEVMDLAGELHHFSTEQEALASRFFAHDADGALVPQGHIWYAGGHVWQEDPAPSDTEGGPATGDESATAMDIDPHKQTRSAPAAESPRPSSRRRGCEPGAGQQ